MDIKSVYKFENKVHGEVGIEIELEGSRLPGPASCTKYWKVINDRSLRGEAYEYVLRQPVKRKNIESALKELSAALGNYKSKVLETGRAGTHIHINIRDMSVTHFRNFIALYQILEEPLIKWCGPQREGNLFCLRGKDAEGLIQLLIQHMRNYRWQFSADGCKYAALNLSAVPKYGSLEFRAMKSTADMSLIKTWAEMLLKVKDAASTFSSPASIVEGMSGEGELRFLNMVMGGYNELLACSGVEQMLRNGARLVQNWAYVKEEKKEPLPKKKKEGVDFNFIQEGINRVRREQDEIGARLPEGWVYVKTDEIIPQEALNIYYNGSFYRKNDVDSPFALTRAPELLPPPAPEILHVQWAIPHEGGLPALRPRRGRFPHQPFPPLPPLEDLVVIRTNEPFPLHAVWCRVRYPAGVDELWYKCDEPNRDWTFVQVLEEPEPFEDIEEEELEELGDEEGIF